jgi:hypothetical protein
MLAGTNPLIIKRLEVLTFFFHVFVFLQGKMASHDYKYILFPCFVLSFYFSFHGMSKDCIFFIKMKQEFPPTSTLKKHLEENLSRFTVDKVISNHITIYILHIHLSIDIG